MCLKTGCKFFVYLPLTNYCNTEYQNEDTDIQRISNECQTNIKQAEGVYGCAWMCLDMTDPRLG